MVIFDFLDGFLVIVITYLQLAVLIVHEFAPAVGGASQHVVETLVILYQIREDMFHHPWSFLLIFLLLFLLLLFLLWVRQLFNLVQYARHFRLFCQALELQPLHEFSIVRQFLAAVVRQGIILHFLFQDVVSKLLPYKRAAGLLQRQHLVETVDLQPQVHAVGQIFRNHLMYIEIIKDLLGDVIPFSTHQAERDLSELEDGFNEVSVNRLPVIFRTFGYGYINRHFRRLIHLLFHTKAFERVGIPKQHC